MNCIKARVDLLDHLYPRDTGDSAVWLAVSGRTEADDDHFSPLITQQIAHVANSRSCQKWLDFIDPSRIIAREKAEKYCCVQMQGAVDGDAETKFSFKMFRNESDFAFGTPRQLRPRFRSQF